MSALGVLALLAASPVGIHVEEAGEVSLREAAVLATDLGRQVEARMGRRALVEDPTWRACSEPAACRRQLLEGGLAPTWVFLRLFGGPTKLRVIAERVERHAGHSGHSGGGLVVEQNVPRDPELWGEALGAVAAELFPEPPLGSEAPRGLVEVPAEPPVEVGPRLAPWIAVGSGVVLASVGVGFGLSSHGATRQILERPLSDADYRDARARADGHGTAANVIFGAAAVALVTAAVIWTLEGW